MQKWLWLPCVLIAVAVLGANIYNALRASNWSQAREQLWDTRDHLLAYRKACGRFPLSAEGLQPLRAESACGHDFKPLRYPNKDPWATPLVYDSDGKTFVLGSLAADKAVGGSGRNADIWVNDHDETYPRPLEHGE